ncbi:MAG: hypothetical protein V7636_1660, partial [Actinomycetota bacterium]
MSYSLRSWFGIAVFGVIALGALSRLIGFDDEPIVLVMSDSLFLCATPAVLVWLACRRIDVVS